MKKFMNFFFVAAMVALCVGFSFCSKDDDEGGNSDIAKLIVGKWQLVESTDSELDSCDYNGWDEFKSDGSWKSLDACGQDTTTGKWTAEKNSITVVADALPIPIVLNIKSITDKELVVEIANVSGGSNTNKLKKIQ